MVTIPQPLLGLPNYWRRLDVTRIKNVGETTDAETMDVLERCLRALKEIPDSDVDEFPEFITIAIGLWAGSFARLMPTFEQFRQDQILETFSRQTSDITVDLVERYAASWLRYQVTTLASHAIHLIEEWVRATPNPTLLKKLRELSARYWMVDECLAHELLDALWLLDFEASVPLFIKISSSRNCPDGLKAELIEWIESGKGKEA